MNDAELISITTDRMAEWAKDMICHHTTPALAVSVGHDRNSGEIHIYVSKQFELEHIELFLLEAFDQVRKRRRNGL